MATTLAKDKKGQATDSYYKAGISGAVPEVNQFNTQLQQAQNQLKQAGTGSGSASMPAISGVKANGGGQQTYQPYTGLAGVSDNTARQTGRYQQDYQAGDAVTRAQQQLAAIQAQKPQGYTSKYTDQLNGILEKITNPEKFKYEFNQDELFRGYADYYTQMAKQASQDAMGQAAALTGGYGNTYAQSVANQQYQQALLPLYDKGLEMYDRAWQRYQGDRDAQMDAYNVLANADQTDYGRYRDEYGDWQNERDYYTGRYDTESERDYSRWSGNRDYWTGLAQVENADYRNEQERQEAIRQYNEDMAYKKAQDDRQYAYNYAMAILEKGQMPSIEILKLAGLSEADAKKLMKQVSSGGGGGTTKKTPDRINPNTVAYDNPETSMQGEWHPNNEMSPEEEEKFMKSTGDKIGGKNTGGTGNKDTVTNSGGDDLIAPKKTTGGTSKTYQDKKNRNVSVK